VSRQDSRDNRESREGDTENGGKVTKRKEGFFIVANNGQPGSSKSLTASYLSTAGI
jgi:hypothetical protein